MASRGKWELCNRTEPDECEVSDYHEIGPTGWRHFIPHPVWTLHRVVFDRFENTHYAVCSCGWKWGVTYFYAYITDMALRHATHGHFKEVR